jgi:cobalamin biosynthesis Co2+ chelatase CbiK
MVKEIHLSTHKNTKEKRDDKMNSDVKKNCEEMENFNSIINQAKERDEERHRLVNTAQRHFTLTMTLDLVICYCKTT